MKLEYETKILDIDEADINKKLLALGFLEPKHLDFKRWTYDFSNGNEGFVRLRSDGKKCTLTYKNFKENSISGVQELEIIVDDFENTNELVKIMGLVPAAYQENKRILYSNDEIEISIDYWPKISPYLEIEGMDEKVVHKYIELLGFKLSDTTSVSTKDVYTKYNLNIDDFKILKFN